MASAGSSAVGVGAIGFGVLLIYSAFTGKPVFGADGLIRTFVATGSVEKAGKAAGKAATDLQRNLGTGQTIGGVAGGLGTSLGAIAANLKPPGAK